MLNDTQTIWCLKEYFYIRLMENSKNNTENTQGVEFWENEVEYFTNAIEGLQTAYSLLSHMRQNAMEKVASLMPEREEVE